MQATVYVLVDAGVDAEGGGDGALLYDGCASQRVPLERCPSVQAVLRSGRPLVFNDTFAVSPALMQQ